MGSLIWIISNSWHLRLSQSMEMWSPTFRIVTVRSLKILKESVPASCIESVKSLPTLELANQSPTMDLEVEKRSRMMMRIVQKKRFPLGHLMKICQSQWNRNHLSDMRIYSHLVILPISEKCFLIRRERFLRHLLVRRKQRRERLRNKEKYSSHLKTC